MSAERTLVVLKPDALQRGIAFEILSRFEKRGLRYVSLEVGPRNLTKDVVDQFNRLATEDSNQPLFVFDRDGALAGAMWYLHFRTAGQESDEVARLKAARLGLREDSNGEHRAMWLAIQKFLSQRQAQ